MCAPKFLPQLAHIDKKIKKHTEDVKFRKDLEVRWRSYRNFIEFCYTRPNTKPSLFQRAYLKAAIKALLPTCFGFSIWKKNINEILNTLGLNRLCLVINATAPRRFGKTKINSVIGAGIMLFFQNPENDDKPLLISVFSVGMDASKRFLAAVMEELNAYRRAMGDALEHIIDDGKEEIKVYNKTDKSKWAKMVAQCGHGVVSTYISFHSGQYARINGCCKLVLHKTNEYIN
jgi:hypothetical protein